MELKERVSAIIDKIKPFLNRDSGDIELVDIDESDKTVLVRLRGACHGCPMSTMTIKGLVEKTLKEEIPEITGVRIVP